MAVCTSCGREADEASKFCTGCGQPLAKAAPAPAPVSTARTCPACHAPAEASSAFCTSCGQSLSAGKAAPERTIPVVTENTIPVAAPVGIAPAAVPPPPTYQTLPQPTPPQPSEPSYSDSRYQQPPQPGGGKFGLVVLILLVVIAAAGLGAWYFWGVETIVVCSPPDVRVFLDEKEITPASYGRYVIPHLSRKPHLLKVQSPGFADTVQRLDFPLSSSQEWVNVRLVPSAQLSR